MDIQGFQLYKTSGFSLFSDSKYCILFSLKQGIPMLDKSKSGSIYPLKKETISNLVSVVMPVSVITKLFQDVLQSFLVFFLQYSPLLHF